jgi:hypothetical protein
MDFLAFVAAEWPHLVFWGVVSLAAGLIVKKALFPSRPRQTGVCTADRSNTLTGAHRDARGRWVQSASQEYYFDENAEPAPAVSNQYLEVSPEQKEWEHDAQSANEVVDRNARDYETSRAIEAEARAQAFVDRIEKENLNHANQGRSNNSDGARSSHP